MGNALSRLEKQGKLKKQKAGISQIENLLRESIADLKEAKKTLNVSQRATYILAYMAMLKGGRALLLFQGYRPIDGAQHKTVVEVTESVLGEDYKNLTQHFEIMRRKRNEMTYEVGGLLTASETKLAFDDAISLIKSILNEVKAKDPQLKLNFRL